MILYAYINKHSKHAAIVIEQPQTRHSRVTYFAPGEFQINVNNIEAGASIDTFPLPTGNIEHIRYKERRIYPENGLTLRYFFVLSNTRASISVRPLEPRDKSPTRKKKKSSSSSFSLDGSSSSSSPKKRKGLFSLW